MQLNSKLNRRNFIKTSSLFALAVSMPGFTSCKDGKGDPEKKECLTTADILGPFYKADSPFREDIIPSENNGAPLIVQGRVLGDCDVPLNGSLVEIWNANMDGEYDNTALFKFRGSFKTAQDGLYRFKTIIPGRYLNGASYRPSHIHFRITAPNYQELISQIYFKDDPFIDKDPWAGDLRAVERILTPSLDENGIDTVTFDIYLTHAPS